MRAIKCIKYSNVVIKFKQMRIIKSLTLLILMSVSAFAQNTKEVKTKVNEVCVFIDAAQITRHKVISLNKGEQIVKFINLSPFIDPNSVRVSTKGNIVVLSVNHQKNYLHKMQKSAELIALETKLENLNDKITREETYLFGTNQEISFLTKNREIGGKNQTLTLSALQQLSAYYGKRITELQLKLVTLKKKISKLNKEKGALQKQINDINNKNDYPSGEVLVKVDAKTSGNFTFDLSYLVDNASWYPSYDIRVKNINSPVQLVYKANVQQNTKVDWTNAKLTFSSAEPNQFNYIPELQTYFLYYSRPSYSYRGVPKVAQVLNVVEDEREYEDNLDVDIAYDTKEEISKGKVKSPTIKVEQNMGETNVNFTIQKPYTIKSDDKLYTVTMQDYSIPATYKYFIVPKINPNAILIADITDFRKYNLLNAETNIFFENTFIGTSLIDVENANDTLKISLGKDKQVYVKRESVKNFTNKQFIGSKKEETKDWQITIQNNKNKPISLTLHDQVPVSTNQNIEVKVIEVSNGSRDVKTGKVVWKLQLQPNEKKIINLKYSVKYPKDKRLILR